MARTIMRNPLSIARLMHDTLKDMGIAERIEETKILRLWNEIVGDFVAQKVKPIKISRKKLYVHIGDSAFRQEFVFLKKEILKQIEEKAGKGIISDISFTSKRRSV